MRRLCALGLVLACSCAALTGLDDLSVDDAPLDPGDAGGGASDGGAGPGRDAAPSGPADARPPSDAGGDAPDAAPTPPCPADGGLAAPLDPRWALRGNASGPLALGVQLTPNAPTQAGALFWNVPLPFARFDAEVTLRIVATQTPAADGIGFAWLDAQSVPATLSGAGTTFGLSGAKGFAVLVDTYRNADLGDSAVPFVAVRRVDTMATLRASRRILRLADGQPHTLQASVKDGAITVRVDGDVEIESVSLGPGAPSVYSGYFAAVAATGELSAAHYVSKVVLRAGTTGACAVTD
ncbi:MAG: hypothetical protein KF894_15255 [Labilithrix sp.]|nr:hypothetical protein [Labilithrix sp.]